MGEYIHICDVSDALGAAVLLVTVTKGFCSALSSSSVSAGSHTTGGSSGVASGGKHSEDKESAAVDIALIILRMLSIESSMQPVEDTKEIYCFKTSTMMW